MSKMSEMTTNGWVSQGIIQPFGRPNMCFLDNMVIWLVRGVCNTVVPRSRLMSANVRLRVGLADRPTSSQKRTSGGSGTTT